MEEHASTGFLPLLLVLLLAFVVPLLLARFKKIPVVVGEILAGVIIGQSVLNLVEVNATLEVMSDIGLAFLMFLAGMEIDFSKLFPPRGENKPSGPNIPAFSFVVYLLTLGLAVPGGFLLTRLGLEGDPFLLAFILSATSLGVLLPVLKERGLVQKPSGQAIFVSALLADFVTVLLLTIYIITLDRGLDPEIFTLGLLFVAFFLVYRLFGRFTRIPGVRRVVEELSQATVQLKVRGAITILMAFVVLAEFLGAELILGAFLGGMVISLIKAPQDDDLVHKLEAFGFGFFIPVFFILAGVSLDMRALFESPESIALLPVILLLSLVVKVVPALIFRRFLSWRETFSGALLLNTHLSLEIAVAVIGLRLGLISPATNAAIIVFAVLTVFLMPVLFNALQPPAVEDGERFYLVFGAKSDLSQQVANDLRLHGDPVIFVEPDPQLATRVRDLGFEVIESDNCEDLVRAVGPERVRAFLVLGTTDERNLKVSQQAVCAGVEHIVAQVFQPANIPQFRELGVRAFSDAIYRSTMLAMLARNPDLFTLLTSTTDQQDIREVQLKNPFLSGRRVRHLQLKGDLLIVSISREGEMLIPHGNMRLEFGDRLTLLGSLDALQDARMMLEAV
ncbi:MAG: monovalent cation:proton antiporter family protein [Anaerolineales bacterium]|nr:monovalent cation:proton antiporter family protein [Anaerolineales bacterium]